MRYSKFSKKPSVRKLPTSETSNRCASSCAGSSVRPRKFKGNDHRSHPRVADSGTGTGIATGDSIRIGIRAIIAAIAISVINVRVTSNNLTTVPLKPRLRLLLKPLHERSRVVQAANRRLPPSRLLPMEPTSAVRVDKWLWSVRFFKTRSLATHACAAGHVRVNEHPVKPARPIRAGEIVSVQISEMTRTVKVLDQPASRVGAKLVPRFYEDLTPPSEYEKARQKKVAPVGARPKGSGRPTKKERRVLGSFFGLDE